MGEVFAAFAQQKGVDVLTLRFILESRRVGDDDTAISLSIGDLYQIDAFLFVFYLPRSLSTQTAFVTP